MKSRRGDQAGAQEDNLNAVSMAMLMKLQKEFETLNLNTDEELSILIF